MEEEALSAEEGQTPRYRPFKNSRKEMMEEAEEVMEAEDTLCVGHQPNSKGNVWS